MFAYMLTISSILNLAYRLTFPSIIFPLPSGIPLISLLVHVCCSSILSLFLNDICISVLGWELFVFQYFKKYFYSLLSYLVSKLKFSFIPSLSLYLICPLFFFPLPACKIFLVTLTFSNLLMTFLVEIFFVVLVVGVYWTFWIGGFVVSWTFKCLAIKFQIFFSPPLSFRLSITQIFDHFNLSHS